MERIMILLQEINDLMPNRKIIHASVSFGTIYSSKAGDYYFKHLKYRNNYYYIEMYFNANRFYRWDHYNIKMPKRNTLIKILEEIKQSIIEYNIFNGI